MRPALRRLFLLALETDLEAQPAGDAWQTRCLHCRTRLQLRTDGTPLGPASLEHVVPRAWFSKRVATSLVERVGGDPDDARNLAIACARCNHDKGKGPDARGPSDARAFEVVGTLLDTRLARWREPTGLGETRLR
jgi:5-methylcytosine-specific restriction endonuclease McrA